jgi:hypothetical protein
MRGQVELLLFPNDTSRLPLDLLEQLQHRMRGAEVGAMTYVNPDGARYSLPVGDRRLDRSNVWSIIEPAMVLAMSAFDRSGGFDPGLGTGSAGPFQSGEGTDLLLRLERDGVQVRFLGDLQVLGPGEADGLTSRQRHRKVRGYARGYGLLHRRWRFGPTRFAWSVLGAATLWIRARGRFDPVDSLLIAVGRVEGYLAPRDRRLPAAGHR